MPRKRPALISNKRERRLLWLAVTTKRDCNPAMDFEWDADKAIRNLRKHGVSFSAAARALLDPGRIEMYDGRENYGEDR